MTRRGFTLLLGLAAFSAPALSAPPVAAPPAAEPAPPAAEPARRAVPEPALHLLFTEDDYPEEAMEKDEAGTVEYRLQVGADGRVSDCIVHKSSGSAALDSTACRLLIERARFKPAADAAGKAVPDTHRGRITWTLPEPVALPPRAAAALSLWTGCIWGEVAKLTQSSIPPADVTARAFAGCTRFQGLFASEIRSFEGFEDSKDPAADFKEEFAKEAVEFISTTRATLAPEGKK